MSSAAASPRRAPPWRSSRRRSVSCPRSLPRPTSTTPSARPGTGEVGASDPVAAASEALHQYPAELILVVAAERDRGGWENGLFERAQNELDPPVRMVAIGPQQAEPAAPRPAAPIHHAGRAERLPRFSNGDPVAIGAAVVGAILGIAVIVLILISLFD